jgi:hypothetical protein
MKLCKDCCWAAYELIPLSDDPRLAQLSTRLLRDPTYQPPRHWLCKHVTAYMPGEPDLVIGKPAVVAGAWLKCQTARISTFDDHCGPEGQYWEAKEE